jgi:hypothetical protein
LTYSLVQDPQARCTVPLLHVYAQVYSLVWACLCLRFNWMFYLEIKSTLVILWSIFIPLKINNAMNNIYQLALISCAILSLSSWPLIPLTTIPKSEKFRFPKRVWSQGFRIRDCVPVLHSLPSIHLDSEVKFANGRNCYLARLAWSKARTIMWTCRLKSTCVRCREVSIRVQLLLLSLLRPAWALLPIIDVIQFLLER